MTFRCEGMAHDWAPWCGHYRVCRACGQINWDGREEPVIYAAAWYRGHRTPGTPNGPEEYDVDMVFGDDPPEGEGWRPLYRERPVSTDWARMMLLVARDRGRAECAKIAREEAAHQRAIARKQPYTEIGERSADRASHRAAVAERIARAIERGER